jgi:putative FmdB family regulatory protein
LHFLATVAIIWPIYPGPKEEPEMPTYDYLCGQCGEKFTRYMSLKEYESEKVACPKCNSPDVKQQLGDVMVRTSRKS